MRASAGRRGANRRERVKEMDNLVHSEVGWWLRLKVLRRTTHETRHVDGPESILGRETHQLLMWRDALTPRVQASSPNSVTASSLLFDLSCCAGLNAVVRGEDRDGFSDVITQFCRTHDFGGGAPAQDPLLDFHQCA